MIERRGATGREGLWGGNGALYSWACLPHVRRGHAASANVCTAGATRLPLPGAPPPHRRTTRRRPFNPHCPLPLRSEGDLVTAEVQTVRSTDGSVMLHTRSLKYGKLAGGQLVEVPANLIKRQRQHFVTLEGIGERRVVEGGVGHRA